MTKSETTKNIFYTYAWLRKNGVPYYIGKGKGRRAWRKGHPKGQVLILKKDLSEQEAFKHETYMISVFGRKDLGTGVLVNFTDGGEGSSGYLHTEATKQKMRVPASDNHKQKLSEVRRKLWQDSEYREMMTRINKESHQTEQARENNKRAQLNRDPNSDIKQKITKRSKWKKEVWDLTEKAINSSLGYFWGKAEISEKTGETKGVIGSMASLIRKGITWERALLGES